jgi:hypothetical protein
MAPPDEAPSPSRRGARAAWSISALVFLASTALPWSCNQPPVRFAVEWVTDPAPGLRALGLSITLPLVALAVVAAREARARHGRAGILAAVSAATVLALSIAAFSDALPERHQPQAIIAMGIPRPIAGWRGAARAVIRLLLLAPVAAVASWGLAAARTAGASSVAARWMVSFTAAALTLLWAPACEGTGFWLGVVSSALLALLAAAVPDPAPSPSRRVRALLTGAVVMVLAVLGAMMFSKRAELAARLSVAGLR